MTSDKEKTVERRAILVMRQVFGIDPIMNPDMTAKVAEAMRAHADVELRFIEEAIAEEIGDLPRVRKIIQDRMSHMPDPQDFNTNRQPVKGNGER